MRQDIRKNRFRFLAVAALTAATVICAAAAYITGINPPASNVAGAFISIAVFAAAAYFIKAQDTLFYCGLIFVFMASPLGSVMNFYRTVDMYDKVVHLISGFLLASAGMVIIHKLFEKTAGAADPNHAANFFWPMIFAACMFSGGAAGIWEIFEFTADRLAGGEMQRGMVDTVTDMIAGNIGAALYGIAAVTRYRRTER